MDEITVIGIDCATDETKVGFAVGIVRDDVCTIQLARNCHKSRGIADEVNHYLQQRRRILLALDAPLGWPEPLGKALAAHSAGDQISFEANLLFRRHTDRFVKEKLGKQSLDVGADRIARTAHAALGLLSSLRKTSGEAIPLAWEPSYTERVAAIEVYPAATFIGHGIKPGSYKKKGSTSDRDFLISQLGRKISLPSDITPMQESVDALDAVACVLAGFDFLRGQSYEPSNQILAHHEGWIWARRQS